MNDINLDSFFTSDIDAAFAEAASNALPCGEYRWKITGFTPVEQMQGGIPAKLLRISGHNADTGEAMVRTWRLTGKDGQINAVQVRMLGEQLIKSGIRTPVKALIGADLSKLPVVTLKISERVTPEGKVYPENTILACAKQDGVKEAADATPF